MAKGQYPTSSNFNCVLTASTTTLTLTFSKPVNVAGTIPVTVVGGPTFVSQTVVSATVVTQTWSATLVGHTATLPSAAANVTSYQGGVVNGTSASF